MSLIENLIKSNRDSLEDISVDDNNFNDTQDNNFIKDVLKETILSQRAHHNNEPLSPYDLMN